MSDAGVKFGRIPKAVDRSGLSRAMLYKIAAKNPGLFRKAGEATIVDLCKLDQILADLPAAEITTGRATERDSAA